MANRSKYSAAVVAFAMATVLLAGTTKACPKSTYCFAIDESTSVSATAFRELKGRVKELGAAILEKAPGSLLAAVGFAKSAHILIRPTSFLDEFNIAMEGNTQLAGTTNTDSALGRCRNVLKGKPKPHMVILISNGGDLSPKQAAAKALKRNDVTIGVIKVGLGPNDKSLDGIASDGHGLLRSFPTFGSLRHKVIDVVTSFCGALPIPQPVCLASNTCHDSNICFAIYESGPFTSLQLEMQAQAIVAVISSLLTLIPQSSFALVGFSNRAETIVPLSFDVQSVLKALLRNSAISGGTSSGEGLKRCQKLLKDASGPKVIVMVTDGKDNKKPFGTSVDEDIKAKGTSIVTVGIGNQVEDKDLQYISSADDKNYRVLYTPVYDFDLFSAAIGPIVRDICRASVLSTGFTEEVHLCASVLCMQCGKKLQCYVDSGHEETDRKLCAMVVDKKQMCPDRGGKETICKQPCKGRRPVVCYPTEWYTGYRGDKCKKPTGRKRKVFSPLNFAIYDLCTEGPQEPSCIEPKCSPALRRCWPLENPRSYEE